MGTLSGVASAATLAAGAATKATGAYDAASSRQASLNYQASVAASNAQLAQDKVSITEDVGQQQVQDQDLKVGATFGMQRAQLGANGVDLGQGSANDLLTSTQLMGARDAATIQDNALRTAWGYSVQGAQFTNDSTVLTAMAGSINPTQAATTSMLSSLPGILSAANGASKAVNGLPSTVPGASTLLTGAPLVSSAWKTYGDPIDPNAASSDASLIANLGG